VAGACTTSALLGTSASSRVRNTLVTIPLYAKVGKLYTQTPGIPWGLNKFLEHRYGEISELSFLFIREAND